MEKIRNVFAATFQIPPETVSETSSRQTLPIWDSIGHINLVMAMEKAFGITFTAGEILDMQDVPAIQRLLQEKGVL